MRLFMIDTLTTIVFFTIVAALVELFVAGLEPREVLITRALMIPIMIATGRPYGAFRDWVFGTMRPRGAIASASVDVLAFTVFQMPIYAATLFIAGADLAETATAVISALVFMLVLGRPFGLILDLVRRVGRVTP